MIRRTIAAALLAGLAAPALAGQFASPTYDQAAGLANGKVQADASYDGSAARAALAPSVAAAAPAAPTQTILTPVRPAFAPEEVPAPSPEAAERKISSVRHVLYGADAAPARNGQGRALLALGGALTGVATGFGIGFAMSKMLA